MAMSLPNGEWSYLTMCDSNTPLTIEMFKIIRKQNIRDCCRSSLKYFQTTGMLNYENRKYIVSQFELKPHQTRAISIYMLSRDFHLVYGIIVLGGG